MCELSNEPLADRIIAYRDQLEYFHALQAAEHRTNATLDADILRELKRVSEWLKAEADYLFSNGVNVYK